MARSDALDAHLAALFGGLERVITIEIDRTNEEMERGVRDRSAARGTNRYVQLEERRNALQTHLDNLRRTVIALDDEDT